MNYLGDFPTGATVYVFFHTFNSSGASVTITGLAVTDIEIYKDGSVTQRSSDAGYTLLDTDGTDFDGLTGIHGFSIDLSDNTDSGFYAAGHEYVVVVSSITADSQTVSFVAASFSIERSGGVLALLKAGSVAVASVTAGVTLANDAITAAKFDETTAFPLASADSGATQVARVGADGDTLETLSDQLDATATAAALATVDGIVDDILVDTGTTLDALIKDVPTVAEFEARTLPAADYFDPAADTVAAVTTVGSVTGNVGGNVTGSVGSVAAGGITAASIATDAIDADALAADAIAEINATVDTAISDAALATAAALATVDANVDAILADTGTDGVALSSAAIDAIYDEIIEGTLTARQLYRILLAEAAGKSSGGGTTSIAFRDQADSKNRISATVSATTGDRSAVTLDGS